MSEQISITLPGYQWEAILRGLASSGWDSMHALLTQKLAHGVVAEEPEWEYGYDSIADAEAERPTMRRRKAGPWVPVEQEGRDET
ncbi:hypothetical protein [Pseudactinotalea sp.]|uniref:hypothetical protein n=1 Tax=Pseudactinotalea sp. TaxID=1926260 RepID=UPI003B3B56D2